MRKTILLSRLIGASLALLLSANTVLAAGYPAKPITMIVPFSAGGATDQLGRYLGQRLSDKLGQPVIIENKPGAGTVVAAAHVAKSAPDGYTLFLSGSSGLTLNPAIRSQLPYDPLQSYAFISHVAFMDLLLLGNSQTQEKSLEEVVQTAKANPQALSYGSFGVGSTAHFAGEMLKDAKGAKIMHIPFNGSSQNLTALIGNQMPLAVDTIVASLPHIRAGTLHPIALLSAERSALLPDVPTVAEMGSPGFEIMSWFAVVAPAGLPDDIRQTLDDSFREIVSEPETRDKLLSMGLTPGYASGDQLQEMVKKELPLMKRIAQSANIQVQ
ncbi:Bug family tripartite tricarboxylate transporter substrate binding protein [Pollutimonas harenae]|uniref:Tripartite tricarboxylate transporter substrate binding protein n=1 Tax=Pollutimonas harenae TaxID=657015 RepID=A0A853GWP6_9BURK|nr:tripartite tricarboxylate transporter substrate binding protein [Pollutimonas harenae]NYT86771.1 tripartite tricarboxylate transporter substrate binding protein [Pollutimonas harenae]TEA71419.1 tripartite tricarboxylate transporter substrate binding protein [Pollutimonas harenae]